MATASQSAAFGEILLSVRRRLIDRLGDYGVGEDRVLIVTREDKASYLAERHVRVRSLSRQLLADPGAGRRGMIVVRTVALDLYTRNTADGAADDTVALTEAKTDSNEGGHLAFEDAVSDALCLWSPTDEDDAALTVEPLHEAGPVEDPRRPADEGDYLISTLYVEAKYLLPLTVPLEV